MAKRNKIRYTSEQKNPPKIVLTGRIFLKYRDDEEIESGKKGDVMLFPSVETLHTVRQGDYGSTGTTGYFRVDVFDGRDWRPVLLQELFPGKEHHFSKTECPIDTYAVCEEIMSGYKDRLLVRTYREHYMLEEQEEPTKDAPTT